MRLISMAYSTNSWSSYQTAWMSFRAFCIKSDTPAVLPVTIDTLIDYINYLANWRKLQISTIKGYVSALRLLHVLNRYPKSELDNIFLSDLVKISLRGVENICKINEKPSNPRRVMSFPCMQLLGHGLMLQGFSHFDVQLIWTACTLGFWGSFRMSELLPTGEQPHQVCNALSWKKVFKPNTNQLTITVKFPKSMKDGSSDAVNVYRYMDENYCPVTQLCKLYNIAIDLGKFDPNDLIFRLQSGALLTTTILNKILRNVMSNFFDGNHSFSCHSFRAGVPSHMAALPNIFNESEIMVMGRWTSDAFARYTRLNGFAREIALSKLQNVLNKT